MVGTEQILVEEQYGYSHLVGEKENKLELQEINNGD